MYKFCIICNKTYIAKAGNQKICSKLCFVEHRKNRISKIRKEKVVSFNCKFCDALVIRDRTRNGFCNRSCASKHYYQQGNFDKWQKTGLELNLKNKKSLVEMKCCVCNKTYFIKLKEYKRNRSKTCSITCRRIHTNKQNSGSNSHFFGKPYPKEYSEKRLKTIKEKYGVTNTFALAKNRKTISKGQLQLYNILKDHYQNKLVEKEKRVTTEPKEFFADILFRNEKIIVEYNGDFWHCNPAKYKSDYFNPKKKLYALNIWEEDKKRINILESNDYIVIVVWEHDFIHDHDNTIKNLLEKINNEFDRR